MSGLVSPKSIGLANEEEIYKLIKRSKILFCICEIYPKLCFILAFIIYLTPFTFKCSLKQVILYRISHSLNFCFGTYFIQSRFLWQIVYFYIICYYLKLRLSEVNDEMKAKTNRMTEINDNYTYHVIRSLHSMHSQIYDYNDKSWPKFLF
jgi:hypothetical protein